MLDAAGNQIAISQTSDPTVAGVNNELIIIPVVGQQRYYLRVFSTAVDLPNDVPDAGPVQVPNVYDLEIENFAAPIPAIPDLDAASDSGMSDADNVTRDTTPTVTVQVDLTDFETEFGLNPSPTPSGIIDSNGAAGADVQVLFTNVATGLSTVVNATRIGGAGTAWTATSTALVDGA